jgi:uncharacterized protein YwgA
MIEREDFVAAIVNAAGGELVGRVRLQKAAYLLERLGLGRELNFEYHHYGPYSRELDNATLDAKAFGLIREEYEHRQSDGALFSRFKLEPETVIKDEAYGQLGRERVAEFVQKFVWTNVTVLELAATIDWLWRVEKYADWRAEITRRKGKKVQGGRLEKAIELLHSLDLAPPPPAAAHPALV